MFALAEVFPVPLAMAVPPQWLEGLMLLCFGASWPFSIAKVWRERRSDGKSLIFLWLVFVGYLVGVAAKLVRAAAAAAPVEGVTFLYGYNACLVFTDILLCIRFRPTRRVLDL